MKSEPFWSYALVAFFWIGTQVDQSLAQSASQPPLPLAEPAAAPESEAVVTLAEGESPIDLGTALQLAGVQNPELLLARERITEAMAVRQLAAAQALPNINIGLNYDLHRGPLQQSNGNILKVNRDAMFVGLGANAIAAGSVNIPGINYNLNVGVAWFNYLQSKQVVVRSAASARTAENDTLLKVSLAYTELVRTEAVLAVLKQNQTEASELVRLTEAYAKSGEGRKADADRANVELRKREVDVAQAEANRIAASARLGQLLNLDPAIRLRPLDMAAVPISVVPEPVSVAELVAIALMQRPELEERRAEIFESLYALSSAKLLPFSPNVILGLSTGAFGGGSNLISQPPGFIGADGKVQTGPRFGNFNDRVDFDAVVYCTFQNLGVGNVAITRAAASRSRQAELRQQETLNRIRTEVVETDARGRASLKQIDLVARAVESSGEAFQEDLKRTKGRQGLPIEVIDSMRLLARSRAEYVDAITEFNRAQFRLYVALGQPSAEVLSRPAPLAPMDERVVPPSPPAADAPAKNQKNQ